MIWLVGYKGMLASEISILLTQHSMECIGTDKEVDITDKTTLQKFYKATFQNTRCEWIINCAGYTAVDKAEDDFSMALKLNADSLINIGELSLFIFQLTMYLPVIQMYLILKPMRQILKVYMVKQSWKVKKIFLQFYRSIIS